MNITVNGRKYSLETDSERSLLSVLREELHLTGAKYGCGEAQCGACTVLLDGKAVPSCITPMSAVGQRPVVTVEGLAHNEKLTPLQQAFLEADALQCGYCTSGMIVGATSLLTRTPHPTREEIQEGMQGHVCRCGTYARIVRAIEQAAKNGVQHA
jgi:aerobic-type carbon monoxide dehydrogenase small subunit (CoxS/CutS family)